MKYIFIVVQFFLAYTVKEKSLHTPLCAGLYIHNWSLQLLSQDY